MTWKNTNPGRVDRAILRGETAPLSGAGQECGGSDEDDQDYFASDLYRNLKARRSQIREVIDESTACIYPQFFFYPSSSLGNENVREPIASISLTEAKRIRYVGRDGSKLSTIELKKFCSENLPLYMVPDLFCSLESLPKTSTDKIDYQKLKSMR